AGKTGTSSDNRSAWFVGYTPQLVTAVAMYQVGPNGEEEPITPFGGRSEITGSTFPAAVWTAFMQPVLEGQPVLQFPPRANVGTPNVPPLVDVPDVVGLTEEAARADLERAGFVVEVSHAEDPEVPEGIVISASPSGGQARQGTTVAIVVSQGPPPEPTPTEEPDPTPTPTGDPTPTPTPTPT